VVVLLLLAAVERRLRRRQQWQRRRQQWQRRQQQWQRLRQQLQRELFVEGPWPLPAAVLVGLRVWGAAAAGWRAGGTATTLLHQSALGLPLLARASPLLLLLLLVLVPKGFQVVSCRASGPLAHP
jgi:hypothetical protein